MTPKADQGPGPSGPPDLERLGDLLGEAYAGAGAIPKGLDTCPPGDDAGGVTGRPAQAEVTAKARRAGRGPAAARAPRSGLPASSDPAVDHARQVAAIWQDVVGDEVAANSRPLRLKQGRLSASASSTAWAQTLQFLAGTIGARLNEQLGAEVVKEVVFHHAGWEESPRVAAPEHRRGTVPAARGAADPQAPPGARGRPGDAARIPATPPAPAPPPPGFGSGPPLSKEQREALANVEAMSLEPELKERITRAMMAAFVRDQQETVR